MAKPTTNPRHMETTADESQVQKNFRDEALQDVEVNEKTPLLTFPEIIGKGVTTCMFERKDHRLVEEQIDKWVSQLSEDKEERIKQLDEARKQIETAKLALDAFYTRFRQLAATARN